MPHVSDFAQAVGLDESMSCYHRRSQRSHGHAGTEDSSVDFPYIVNVTSMLLTLFMAPVSAFSSCPVSVLISLTLTSVANRFLTISAKSTA